MKRVVTIGGGTGSFTLLNAIKHIQDIQISAIVAMTDDGGSTGILRDELGVLPPGDVRQCLVALSSESEIIRELMSYRFSNGNIQGHNFGNIFLAGLEKVTGSFTKGLSYASKILKIQGEIFPCIQEKTNLIVELQNGKKIIGEDRINNSNLQKQKVEKIFFDKQVNLYRGAKKKLLEAEYILIAPGNLYCSILPNFLAKDFKTTTQKSKAKIIYIANLTNKKGHTIGFNISNYVEIIEKYLGRKIDIILCNSKRPVSTLVKGYELQEGSGVLVKNDMEGDRRVKCVDLLSNRKIIFHKDDKISKNRSFIRHDSAKLRSEIEKIIS